MGRDKTLPLKHS